MATILILLIFLVLAASVGIVPATGVVVLLAGVQTIGGTGIRTP